jgi:hypothetical protein
VPCITGEERERKNLDFAVDQSKVRSVDRRTRIEMGCNSSKAEGTSRRKLWMPRCCIRRSIFSNFCQLDIQQSRDRRPAGGAQGAAKGGSGGSRPIGAPPTPAKYASFFSCFGHFVLHPINHICTPWLISFAIFVPFCSILSSLQGRRCHRSLVPREARGRQRLPQEPRRTHISVPLLFALFLHRETFALQINRAPVPNMACGCALPQEPHRRLTELQRRL